MWNFSIRRQNAARGSASTEELTERLAELTAANKELHARLGGQAIKLAALEQSEAQLADLARATSDWMWMLDDQLRFCFFSEDFNLAHGDPHNDFMGKTRWEMACADPERDEKWRAHRACLEARRPFRDFRYSCRTPDGRTEYFRTSGVPYYDPQGAFKGYRGTASRETEEVLTRRRATQLEQSYREIYENAVVGIFRATAEGNFVQANPALYKLFNFTDEQAFLNAVNTAPEDLFPEPVLRVAIKREIEKSGTLEAFETELRDRTHEKRVWVSISASEIRDENGKVKHFAGMIKDVTERKHAERELKRRERELALAQRIGRSGHWRWYIRERVIERSEEMCRLLGIPTSSTRSSKTVGDGFIHPQDRPAFQELQKRAIAEGTTYKSEHRVIMPDGEIRYHACEGHLERDETGEVISVFGTNQDVTEQKEAEQALRERERQLNDAQRLGHIGHWRFDRESELTRWSDELWRIFGLEPENRDLVLEEIFTKAHVDDRDRIRTQSEEAWAAHEHFTQDYRIVRPDGSIRYVKVEAHPELDANGKLLAYFGVTHDVTEQTEADAALQASNARNKAIVEALDRATVGLSITTREQGIIDVNSAILKIAGLNSKEELIGRKLPDLRQFSRTDLTAIRREAYETIRKNGTWVGELDWQRPNGEELYLSVRSAPFIDESIVHLVADVTEEKKRKRREAKLEEGLKQSQKMEALGQMAGGIAHEINNLLHPIINFTKLTLNKTPDAQLNHYLARSLECSRKAAEIVNDVLTFSHKGSGERSRVDLVELVSRTNRFAQDITPPDAKLTAKSVEGPLPAEVNETEFIQVVLNLVKNANDAMSDAGEVQLDLDRVKLSAAQSETLGLSGGSFARITVTDHGHGIPDDILEHIFEPFFTTKDVGRGTGLGLSVVYGIVKGWNGAISVESKKNRGTRVKVFVPVLCEGNPALEKKDV